ncbi:MULTISPECIES: hypothetical protein [unclassified Streptomyces]|nr:MULTISPECIES: hypothetical protein [unclassified Streptomyces]MCF0086701.1 hypothetical protein [Streptomyces sp. MH192]MCF0098855.1 hypothetical protein [Streptomyces sp. MH191]
MTRLPALLRALRTVLGQCNRCGGWFDDWPGGICDACLNIGR